MKTNQFHTEHTNFLQTTLYKCFCLICFRSTLVTNSVAAAWNSIVNCFSTTPSLITKLHDSFISDKRGFLSISSSTVCLFQACVLFSCPAQSVILLLLDVSQVSSPRPKSRVSFCFHNICFFLSSQRCSCRVMVQRCTDSGKVFRVRSLFPLLL